MVSIPEFIPHTVTEHKTDQYICLDCGDEFEAENGLPPHGQFDYSVISYVVYEYYHRKTAEMISEDLLNKFGLSVSAETVRAIFKRGAEILKPTRDAYMKELEDAPAVEIDETTHKGEPKRWIGGVRKIDTVVYFHAKNRSSDDLLAQAKNCIGIIGRDGYPGYNKTFPTNKKQRCTQHGTRESKNIAKRTKRDTAAKLYNELSEKFIMLRKWTHGRHSKKKRLAYVSELQVWLRGIISRYRKSNHRLMKKFGTTLENAAPELFTFVIYPYVNSTTNLVEQSMKPVIGQRNNRRQLKSDSGADSLCIMLSVTETWKLRKLNVWDKLREIIGPPAASNN